MLKLQQRSAKNRETSAHAEGALLKIQALALVLVACALFWFVGSRLSDVFEPSTPAARAAWFLKKADRYREKGHMNKALQEVERATHLYAELKDRVGLMEAVLSKAAIEGAAGRKDAADSLHREAINVAEKIGDAALLAQANDAYHRTLLEQGRLADALPPASRAANAYVRLGQWRRAATLMIVLGDAAAKQEEQLLTAEKAYLFTLELYQSGRDKNGIALTSQRIGRLFTKSNPRKAFFYLNQAHNMYLLNQDVAAMDVLAKEIRALNVVLPPLE
jgi:tetratricopeptide (TPR) repeat protein